jgi:hypothetical protein
MPAAIIEGPILLVGALENALCLNWIQHKHIFVNPSDQTIAFVNAQGSELYIL